MPYIVRNKTLAELTSGEASYDYQAPTIGKPTDADGLVFFLGDGTIFIGTDGSPGPSDFTALGDTPNDIVAGQGLRGNAEGTALEFYTLPTHTFLGLGDTPSTVAPEDSGKVWHVNSSGSLVLDYLANNLRVEGTYDASTGNAPSATPTEGEFYVVTTAGTFNSVSYGVDDMIIYAGGAWRKIEGGDGLTGSSSLVGLDDTTGSPTYGQGYVFRADALSPGNDGFALETFIETDLTGSPYAVNRLLVSNGTAYVDVPGKPAPVGTADGQLAWWDAENSAWALLNKGSSGDVLAGNTSTGAPVYTSFQALLNAADVPDHSLSEEDQTVAGNRAVILGTNTFKIEGAPTAGRATTISWDPANDLLNVGARNGANATSFGFLPTSMDLRFVGTASLRFWNTDLSGYESGVAGQAVVSQGASQEPRWGFPRIVLQAPDTTLYEVTVGNEGQLIVDEYSA